MAVPPLRDEVSYTDYHHACAGARRTCAALGSATPDEAAEVLLPRLTQHIAVIFSFVGSNMTARHAPQFLAAQAMLDQAKDGTLGEKPPQESPGS